MLWSFSENVIVSGKPKNITTTTQPYLLFKYLLPGELIWQNRYPGWCWSHSHHFHCFLSTGSGLEQVFPWWDPVSTTLRAPASSLAPFAHSALYLRAVGSPGLQVTWVSLAGNVHPSNTISSVYFVKAPFKFLNFFQWVEIFTYYFRPLKEKFLNDTLWFGF